MRVLARSLVQWLGAVSHSNQAASPLRLNWIVCNGFKIIRLAISIAILIAALFAANIRAGSSLIECIVYPAVPGELTTRASYQCRALRNADSIFLENGFISVEISAASGVIVSIENKLVAERYRLLRDETGVSFTDAGDKAVEWRARDGISNRFAIALEQDDRHCGAILRAKTEDASASVLLNYTLRQNEFWVERRLVVNTGKANYERLSYGRADVPAGKVTELRLGKFDSPKIVSAGKGGVFAGVGWWFYQVEDGLYQNTAMNYATEGRFEAEPWYIGVFQPEPGEPYAGWLWYKTFLSERKLAHDRQRSYFTWNARSGYSFHPINDPGILDFVTTAASIGLDGITTGQARGLERGTEFAANDLTARKVVDAFTRRGIQFGLHEGNVQAAHWRTDAALAAKQQAIEDAARQGIRNLTVDFFKVDDDFGSHRRAAQFFRHIREKMLFSECHLGMAAYGPQFQREVLINHPTDLKGFDISRFSSDWATLLGFRHSRREWQQRFDYLMPENGLYYFCTHYSNYPRRYEEPEPQQFLFIADAWRGLAYAFHDKIGFRDSVAAQAAFSTFYVFGFLDSNMPRADVEFAREYLAWVKDNTDVLSRGRVCIETDDALVMSKIRDSRGAIFAVNYKPGKKRFRMKLALTGNDRTIDVRQIYPARANTFTLPAGGEIDVEIPGERLAIFEINNGLQGLPPENRSELPIDIHEWQPSSEGFRATFIMPDFRTRLARQKDKTLPERLVSVDQTQTEIVTTKQFGKSMGKLPREFLDIYGFEQDQFLPAWKAAPWAFADRVWLVYVPPIAPTIQEPKPRLRINGTEVEFVPRVSYTPKTRLANPEQWTVPLWFADVTSVCKFGGENEIVLGGIKEQSPGYCYIAGAPGDFEHY